MLTLGRLVVAAIGLGTAAISAISVPVYLGESLHGGLEGPTRPLVHVFSSTEAAVFLGWAIVSLVGLVFLSGRRGERQWIGAALIGVGPAVVTGLAYFAGTPRDVVDELWSAVDRATTFEMP